jgi:hypothetical protein
VTSATRPFSDCIAAPWETANLKSEREWIKQHYTGPELATQ